MDTDTQAMLNCLKVRVEKLEHKVFPFGYGGPSVLNAITTHSSYALRKPL